MQGLPPFAFLYLHRHGPFFANRIRQLNAGNFIMDEFGIPAACQRHDADIDRRLQMFCFVMDIDKLLLGIDRLRNKIICAAIYFFSSRFTALSRWRTLGLNAAATEKFVFLPSGFPDRDRPSLNCLISLIKSKDVKSYTDVAPGKSPILEGSPVIASTSFSPNVSRPIKCDCKPIMLRSRHVIWTRERISSCCLTRAPQATLLIRGVAKELSASVRASIPASFNSAAADRNLSKLSFFGGSSSTIIERFSLRSHPGRARFARDEQK